MINARSDVFLAQVGEADGRVELATERGRAYLAAGADCVFVPAVRDADTIGALVRAIDGPVSVLAGTPTVTELEGLGVARVSVGVRRLPHGVLRPRSARSRGARGRPVRQSP